MAKAVRYDLGFNWSTGRETAFTRTIAEAAGRRGLTWLKVLGADARGVRRRVSDGRLNVDLFLNTQADGSNMESPQMLLCRSLKAAGCLVVEDPDDAPIYANRALQLDYLERAGLEVPRRLVIQKWEPRKPMLTAAQQAKLGPSWIGHPVVGLDRTIRLHGTGKVTPSTLSRYGLKPRQGVLFYLGRQFETVCGKGAARIRVWYFFGRVSVCRYVEPRGTYELLGADSPGAHLLPRLVGLTHKMAGVTGLDWFVTEVVVTEQQDRISLLILEPANALAQLGPGRKALGDLPDAIAHVAAERLVEVAWRHSRGLPMPDGVTLRLS